MRPATFLLLALAFAALPASAENGATLRAGDTFEMHVGGVPPENALEFALKYTVGQEGTINVPLIGELKAAGFTPTQLEHFIQAKLITDKVFTHPAVLIDVSQAARYVSFSGGVRNPQRLSWSPDLTLSSGLGICGGLGDFGHFNGIAIVREGKRIGTYNFKEIVKDPSKDPKLLPGDQVIVAE
jgi:polysaccharide export outer membrane protein